MSALAEKVFDGEHQYALGLHEGLPEADYRKAPGANKSYLDDLNVSPAFAKYRRLHPTPQTAAMALGSALHCLVLDGADAFNCCYVVSEFDDYRTKEAREWRDTATADGVAILKPGDYQRVLDMAEALKAHPIAGTLLADTGPTELSMFWVDDFCPEYRRLCKGRLDKWCAGHQIIVDLKKVAIEGAGMSAFARKVHEYRYDCQAAFYTDGAMQCGLNPRAFIFVVVEEDPPYQIATYTLPFPWLQAGRRKYIRDLETLSQCLDSGDWPSYSLDVRELEMPKYAETSPIS